MQLPERLKERRKELGYTLLEIAQKVGVREATVQRWESGKIKRLKQENIDKLSQILRVSPAYLMGWDDSVYSKPNISADTVQIRGIGSIAAGYDRLAVEEWGSDEIEIPRSYLKGHNPDDFLLLTVKGDSMYPMYLNNDMVLILRQSTVTNSGDVAAVIYDSEYATLKKVVFFQNKSELELTPINPEYKPKRIVGSDLESCNIIGVPFMLIRGFDTEPLK